MGKSFKIGPVAASSFHLTAEDACQYYCLDFAIILQNLNNTDLKGLSNRGLSQWDKGGSLLKKSLVALNQSADILVFFPTDAVTLIKSSH